MNESTGFLPKPGRREMHADRAMRNLLREVHGAATGLVADGSAGAADMLAMLPHAPGHQALVEAEPMHGWSWQQARSRSTG